MDKFRDKVIAAVNFEGRTPAEQKVVITKAVEDICTFAKSFFQKTSALMDYDHFVYHMETVRKMTPQDAREESPPRPRAPARSKKCEPGGPADKIPFECMRARRARHKIKPLKKTPDGCFSQ